MKKGLLVFLLLLVGLAVVADRAVEQVAEGVVARQLAAELGSTPSVEVGGFPFLTQALGGSYEEITVEAGTVRRGDVTVQDFRATLNGARVPLSDVLNGAIEQVPVDRMRGSGLVTWATLEDATDGRLTLEPAGGQVRVSGSVTALGQTVEAAALADATVEGPDLLLRATDVTVNGAPAGGGAGAALADVLSLRYEVPELPYDLRLREVEVTGPGVVVSGTARDVLLRR